MSRAGRIVAVVITVFVALAGLLDGQAGNVATVRDATHATTVVVAALEAVVAANTTVWGDIHATAQKALSTDPLATYESQIGLKHALADVADSTSNPQFVGRGM